VAIDPKRVGNRVIHPDELGWTLEQVLDADAIVVSENLGRSNQFFSTGFPRQREVVDLQLGRRVGLGHRRA
jgi:hypothetical protein